MTVSVSKLSNESVRFQFTYGPIGATLDEHVGHAASFSAQLAQLVSAMAPEYAEQEAARRYSRYCQSCEWKSVDGDDLPSWENMPEKIRAHWRATVA
jgi:hypothetical protein